MTRYLTMAGLAVVLTAAAVLSFAALRDLAIAVRVSTHLAFLLPIAVDAGAAVSCAVWLTPAARADARRFACWLTWALLAATVVGNAAQLGMHANAVVPPWWVAVLVGAVPPAVVGGVVHLLVLVGRGAAAPEKRVDSPTRVVTSPPAHSAPAVPAPVAPAVLTASPKPAPVEPTPPPARQSALVAVADVDDRVLELIANGAGRVELEKELGVSEYRARQLLKAHRTNGHQVATS